MPTLHYGRLPEPLHPLLDKFYREQRSPMRAANDAQLWVAKEREIIAGLSLRPLREGFWLTGLLVDKGRRNQGLARGLIDHVQRQCGGVIWLFCHPELEGFYARSGFSVAADLPYELCEKLVRYQRSKPLVALEWVPPQGNAESEMLGVEGMIAAQP
ncbi:hypothetical protein D9M71_184180 [compost metagenome]